MALGTLGFGQQIVNQVIPAAAVDQQIRPLLTKLATRADSQMDKLRVYRIQAVSAPIRVHWAGVSLGANVGLSVGIDEIVIDDSPIGDLWVSGGSFLIQVHE